MLWAWALNSSAVCRPKQASSCPLLSLPEALQGRVVQAMLGLSNHDIITYHKDYLGGERALLSLRTCSKQAAGFGVEAADAFALQLALLQGHQGWLMRDMWEHEAEVCKAGKCRTQRIRNGLDTVLSGSPCDAGVSLQAHTRRVLGVAKALASQYPEECGYGMPLCEVKEELESCLYSLERVQREIARQDHDNWTAELKFQHFGAPERWHW